MPDAWIRPTSFSDPGSWWNAEALAYDADANPPVTFVYSIPIQPEQFVYVEFYHDAISCTKVRVWVDEQIESYYETFFGVRVYYSGSWHNLGSTNIYGQYIEFKIGSTQTVTGIQIYFYTSVDAPPDEVGEIYDVAFWEEPASNIKTINGLAKASVKTFNGLAIASVKSINGLM